MPRLLVLLSWCSFAWVSAAGTATCDPEEVSQLKKQIEQLKAQLGEKCGDSEHLSPLGAARRAFGLGGALVNHALDQTTVDEKVAEHVDTAMAHAAKVKAQVTSVDYNGYVEQVKTNVAPHIDTLATAAKPYMEQYVNPALDQASVHLEPAMKTVKEKYATTSKTLQEDVLPALQRSGSQAFDAISDSQKHVDHAHGLLGRLMDPVFDKFEKIAPGHARALPKEPVDRLVFVLVALYVGKDLFFFALRLARWALKLLGIKLKVAKFSVMLPLRILRYALGVAVWVLTLFYCCGLCRSKKSGATNGKNGDSKTDAKKDPKKKKEAATATEKEVTDFLTGHKKDSKKLEAVAKKLVKFAKNGGLVPEGDVECKALCGKKVAQDIVGKAIRKFKELDIKKLGL